MRQSRAAPRAPRLKSAPPFRIKRKLPGVFGKPTKNAPAIANVRAPVVLRKKNFMKFESEAEFDSA
jgi:hypothetical protein